MLETLNRLLEKAMPIITPASVVIGILLADYLNSYVFLVPWIFAFITFSGGLGSSFKSFRRVIAHPLPVLLAMFILHVLMPAWGFAVGHMAFSGDMFTITGLTLAVIIPTGITSMIWVSIYKGNAALTLTIILVDTFLSPFIVPYSISLLAGEQVTMDVWAMMKGLLGMVVIPSLLAMCLNELTAGKIKEKIGKKLSPFSKLGLSIVVMINSSVIAPYLSKIDSKLFYIATIVLFVSASGYVISWLIGKLLKLERDEMVALLFTGGMRNISAGAVLAISYFPAPVAVPVIIGMLFQQMLASIFGHLLQKSYDKVEQNGMMAEKYN